MIANNRMFLRCKSCGKEFFIGKRLMDGYWLSEYPDQYGKPFMARINEFYEEHTYCRGNGEDCFEISYEFEPEYDDDWEAGDE